MVVDPPRCRQRLEAQNIVDAIAIDVLVAAVFAHRRLDSDALCTEMGRFDGLSDPQLVTRVISRPGESRPSCDEHLSVLSHWYPRPALERC